MSPFGPTPSIVEVEQQEQVRLGRGAAICFSSVLKLIANITKKFHFDQNCMARINCDASHNGLGMALEQKIEGEIWAPIAFASGF